MFFIANVVKVPEGGWVPLALGLVLIAFMTSWKRGRDLLLSRWRQDSLPLASFLARLPQSRTVRVPGMAVFHFPATTARFDIESRVRLAGTHEISFDEAADLVMHRREALPFHANGLRFTAYDGQGQVLLQAVYYSVGGGFVLSQEAADDARR